MDTSEKYIEMCRAATEIQKIWKAEVGDYFWYLPETLESTSFLCNLSLLIDRIGVWLTPLTGSEGKYEIWLPRQDQLQDLLSDNLLDIAEGFYDYMTTEEFDIPEFDCVHCKEYRSMEQLWLAYVMSDKYGKQWDGTKWFDLDAPKEPDVGIMESILIGIRNTETKNLHPIQIRMNCKHRSKLIDELKLMGRWETVDTPRLEIYGVPVSIDETVPNGHIAVIGQPTHIGDSL
jgi:hypothetical protein